MAKTSTEYIVNEANCETGEVVAREMTAEEKATLDANRAEWAAAQAESDSLKESAFSKLRALGLTDDEISAIKGL